MATFYLEVVLRLQFDFSSSCRNVALPGTLAVIAGRFLHMDVFANFNLSYGAIATAILTAAPLCFARESLLCMWWSDLLTVLHHLNCVPRVVDTVTKRVTIRALVLVRAGIGLLLGNFDGASGPGGQNFASLSSGPGKLLANCRVDCNIKEKSSFANLLVYGRLCDRLWLYHQSS